MSDQETPTETVTEPGSQERLFAAPEPTVSKADMDAAIAKAASAERSRILAELGVDDIGAAADVVERQRKAEEAAMTEAEKASAKAQRAQAEAERALAEAAALRQQATIELALTRHGVGSKDLALVARMVEVAADADTETVDTAVLALKDAMPAVFGQPITPKAPTGDQKPPPPPSGSAQPPNRMDAGAARFARMFPTAASNGSAS